MPIYVQDIPPKWMNGTPRFGLKLMIFTGTTTSGVVTFNLTDDNTPTGVAIFTEVMAVMPLTNDVTMIRADSWTVAGNLKTVTMTVKEQTFTGVTILGISALGASIMSNAPNGTSITVLVLGT